jgi:Skp family chaperone for outer membrane proteins
MRKAGAALALMLALAGTGWAQDAAVPGPFESPVLTLDQDRLFRESEFGKAAEARADAKEAALLAENREIFAALEAEEKGLTERRATTSAADFSGLAEAFDTKAESIRAAQDAKGLELTRKRQDDQRRFYDVALPILAKLMTELGAVAILDKQAVIISYDKIDMTDRAIARVDAILGDGSQPVKTP